MILINLFGGPGSGKSTSASHLFSELKMEGLKVELVGEEAKEIIYDKTTAFFANQVLITGRQWQRILRLQQSGCEIAIADSPLIQGTMYIADTPYYSELTALVRKLETLVPQTYNVWVRRVKPYVQFGRYQNEEEAVALDKIAYELGKPFWTHIDGNRHGVHVLVDSILKLRKTVE